MEKKYWRYDLETLFEPTYFRNFGQRYGVPILKPGGVTYFGADFNTTSTTSTKETPKMKPINWYKPLEGAYGRVEGMKAEVYHTNPSGTRYVKYVSDFGEYKGFDMVDDLGRSPSTDRQFLVRNKVEKVTRYAINNIEPYAAPDAIYGTTLYPDRASAERYAAERMRAHPSRVLVVAEVTWEA